MSGGSRALPAGCGSNASVDEVTPSHDASIELCCAEAAVRLRLADKQGILKGGRLQNREHEQACCARPDWALGRLGSVAFQAPQLGQQLKIACANPWEIGALVPSKGVG